MKYYHGDCFRSPKEVITKLLHYYNEQEPPMKGKMEG